jgi:hypothetical protein
MGAATVGVVKSSCHSYSLPSALLQATRYSPHVSKVHMVAGVIVAKLWRSTPYACVPYWPLP